MYKACTHHLPSYLFSMVTPCSSVKGRSSLRSASDGKCVVPDTCLVLGRRSFPTVAGPSIWNSLPPHVRNSLTDAIFRSKLKITSSALPMHCSDFPASVCTSECCKEGYIKLQLHCIVFNIFVQCRSQELLMGFGVDNNVFGNIKCCYFCDKWKMERFYIKIFFSSKPMGAFNPKT